jgi:hypothetical protein
VAAGEAVDGGSALDAESGWHEGDAEALPITPTPLDEWTGRNAAAYRPAPVKA